MRLQSSTLALVLLLALTATAGAQIPSIEVTPSGDVGMGTATPAASLEVERSDGTAQILVEENSGTATDRNLFYVRNNGRPHFRMEDTNGSSKVWDFLASGAFFISRVGSGGTELQLASNGDLTIRGNYYSSAGPHLPDYVFADGYPLMSPDELAEFIEREQHLPNMPSAKDVQEAGQINVTELQLKLLEKIEELTLYTLEQHTVIQELSARLEEQGEELHSLRTNLTER